MIKRLFRKLFDLEKPGPAGTMTKPPKSRISTIDLMRIARKTPAVAHLRRSNIPRLVEARANSKTRIGWPVLFFKAYAIVCERHPDLRRLYVPRPFGKIYEHPVPIGRMAVPRVIDGVEGVFLTSVPSPQDQSLVELQAGVDSMIHDPVEENEILLRLKRLAELPSLVRRIAWSTLDWGGEWRSRWLGTFTLTTVSKFGAVSISPPVFANSSLSFGPISPDGEVDIVLAYDHRATDGAVCARALAELEEVLETTIADELGSLDANPANNGSPTDSPAETDQKIPAARVSTTDTAVENAR